MAERRDQCRNLSPLIRRGRVCRDMDLVLVEVVRRQKETPSHGGTLDRWSVNRRAGNSPASPIRRSRVSAVGLVGGSANRFVSDCAARRIGEGVLRQLRASANRRSRLLLIDDFSE